MIRSGHYAMYRGIEYRLERGMDSSKIVIYTYEKRKSNETFIHGMLPSGREYYEKYVQLWELEDTYHACTGVVEGNGMLNIEKESEDEYFVFASAKNADLIEKYHLIEEDRGIYGGWISKEGTQLRERFEYICYGEKKDPETVPKLVNNTYFQKMLSAEDIPKYLGEEGFSEIQGFIARYDEVSQIQGNEDVTKSFCQNDMSNGKRNIPESGDSYGYIKFKTDHVERLSNLSGEKMDGVYTGKMPLILKGFNEVKNGETVIGFFVNGDKCLKPIDGAELHEVVNGIDTVIAVFREGHFRELDAKEQEGTYSEMIRSGNYGQYNGNEYHVTREDGKDKLKIYTHDKSKTDKTFVPCNRLGERACYKKYVVAFELEKTCQVNNYVVGKESGDNRMLVLKESEAQYLVSVSDNSMDLVARYQLKEVDRGIFHGWVNKKEVQLIENCKALYYLDWCNGFDC